MLSRAFVPRPRRNGVVSQQLDGELLLYVKESHQASSLNASASRVWTLCNGERPLGAIAAEADLPQDVVMNSLRQFAEAGLLENGSEIPNVDFSRRRMLGRIGIGGPVILMVLAPLAKAAASCFPLNHACTVPTDCCSGNCGGPVIGCEP
jgi:hypothetical protein